MPRALASWLVVCLLAAPARADDVVVVTAAAPAADGRSSTTIDASEGEALHLGELVTRSPGALGLDFGGTLATMTLSLRGASASQSPVTLDGLPLASPAGGSLDLALVPATLLGEAVVSRGSDGRLGSGAMGGALQLTATKTTRVRLTGGSLGTFGTSASLGRYTCTPEASYQLTAAVDVRRSSGDFPYHRDPTPEVRGSDDDLTLHRSNNDALLRSALLRLRRRGFSDTWTLLAFGTWTGRGLPGPVYAPTPTTHQDEKTLATQATWQRDGFELPMAIRIGSLDTTDGDAQTLGGSQSFRDASVRPAWSGARGEWQFTATSLAGHETFDGTQFGHRTRARAGFGIELARPKGTTTTSLALRAERWGDATGWLPRAGGSVHLGRGLTGYANAGGGFRAPTFGELYYASGPILANPDLKPERSWSGDLGLRVDRAVRGALTGFIGRYEDVIAYEMFSGSRAKPFNLGRAQMSGAELTVEGRLEHGAARGLGARLVGTYLRAVHLAGGPNGEGRDVPYRPRTKGSGYLDLRRDDVKASVGLEWTARAFANRANTRSMPSFADLRASLARRMTGDLWLAAELRNGLNLMDRATLEGYPLPGRTAFVHLDWVPGAGE
ncbi:MAG: hypothetical protein RL199_235 [Pseudomonadota bacterium]